MKSLLFALLTLFALQSWGQSFQITNMTSYQNSVSICDSVLDISIAAVYVDTSASADLFLAIEGTNWLPSQFSVIVQWGDGTSTTHVGGTSTAGQAITWSPAIQHAYGSYGQYYPVVTVLNTQNSTGASYTSIVDFSSCALAQIYSQVFVDCNNDGQVDSVLNNNVPLVLYNTSNSYSGTLSGGMLLLTNIVPGTYSLMVDPIWLNANGYTVSSSSPIITIVITSGQNVFTSNPILLNCSNSTQNCFFGYVFCDTDSNQVMDNNEPLLSQVPITISYNGVTQTLTSDPNGFFQTMISAPVGTPIVVSVNPNWMAQNGISYPPYWSNSFTVLLNSCQAYDTTFIGLQCDSIINPGQTNCVSGFVWCDANANGIYDASEAPISFAPVTLLLSPNPVTVFTDANGFFNYCGLSTNMVVVAQIDTAFLAQQGYSIGNPIYTLQVTSGPNTQPIGFGVNCGGTGSACANLWVEVTPWIGYYQNQTNYIKLKFGNFGPAAPGNYTVTLDFPAGVTPNLASINVPGYTVSGNTITWNLNSSSTFFSQTDIISFAVPGGIPNGTDHYYTATITPTGSVQDCGLYNNDFSLLQTVGNSYDPNDKNVNLPENISSSVTDEFVYTIRFQNTGTAPAQDVYILDTLTANLDWTTFTVTNASHTMNVIDLGGGVVRFDFPQIWLPDSTTNEPLSHGSVSYRIRENAGNGNGVEINNTAYIYFDWNPAIVTNTTHNINGLLSLEDVENENVNLYPNPADMYVHLNSDSKINAVSLFNLQGQLVLSEIGIESQHVSISTERFDPGVYFVTIDMEGSSVTKRLVIR